MSLVLRPNASKPPPGSRVDWGNPINRGLECWWPFLEGQGGGSNVTVAEIAQSGALMDRGPFTGWRSSPGSQWGPEVAIESGASALATILGHPALNPPDQVTIFMRVRIEVEANTSQHCLWQKSYTSASAPYYQQFMGWVGTTHASAPGAFTGGITVAGTRYAVTSPNNMVQSFETGGTLAITYDGSAVRLYVNGVEEATNSASGSLSSYATDVGIFNEVSGFNNDNTEGGLEDLRFWSRALSAEEIADLHANPYG